MYEEVFERVAYRVSMPKVVYDGVADMAQVSDRSVHMQLVRCIKLGLEVEQSRPPQGVLPRRRKRRSASVGPDIQV